MGWRKRTRGPDGIDLIVADFVRKDAILVRWEEFDAGHRRWIVVVHVSADAAALGYLRGPMDGGHWGHDAEQGSIPLAHWRESGLFTGAPKDTRERLARRLRKLGLEPPLQRRDTTRPDPVNPDQGR